MSEERTLLPLTLGDRNFLCLSERFYVKDAAPSAVMPRPHIHDYYEVFVPVLGDMQFLVNDRLYAIQSGDVVIAGPRELHVRLLQSPCEYESYCFWFLPMQDTPLADFVRQPDMHHHLRFPAHTRQTLLGILHQLRRAEGEGRELDRTACVYQLLALLNGAAEPEEYSISVTLPETFQQVLTYINANFAQIRTVGEVARHFYISTATLNRWFREQLSTSPKLYLESRRLSYSKTLLSRGCSVTQTSELSGFSGCSRFIAVFRETFGITPLQYSKKWSSREK